MTQSEFRPLLLKPLKTILECEEIVRLWPEEGALPPPVDDALERKRIRDLVRRTVPGGGLYKPDALRAVSMATDPAEEWSWRNHAVDVLAALPRPLAFEPLYMLYQHYYHHVALRNTVAGQYVRLVDKPFIERDAVAIFGENPVDGLVVTAFRYRHSIPKLIEHCHLQRSAPVAIHAAHACYHEAISNPLGELEKPWLLGHSLTEAITAMETHLSSNQDHSGFLSALVYAYGALSWKTQQVTDHPILNEFLKRVTQKDMLGRPDERPEVWKFDQEIANLVRSWINDKKIKDFFDSVDAEPARKILWRRAVPVIQHIRDFPACKGFAMKIGDVWFVEFGQTGNACYPYPDDAFQMLASRYWGLSERGREYTGSMKRPSLVYNMYEGTLRHAPRWSQWDDGWHRKFEAYIETFCGVTLE